MRRDNLFGITGVLLLSMIVSLVPAGAQSETYQEAYDVGYGDGYSAGETDRIERRPFDFANRPAYQRAETGFDPDLHDRDVYEVAYRRGFGDGYEDGYGLGEPGRVDLPPTVMDRDSAEVLSDAVTSGRVVLDEGTEFRVRLLQTLSTSRNERGDSVVAELIEPVTLDGDLALPEGTRLHGSITHLKRAGRIRGRAEMTLQFSEMELPNDQTIAAAATVVGIEERADEEVKEGGGTIQAPGEKGEDAKKVGTSAGIGALIGILSGGGSGAKTGAIVGGAVGLGGVLATRGSDLVLQTETELLVRLDRDLTVTTGMLRHQSSP